MPAQEAVVLQDLREPFEDLLSLVEKRRSPRVLDLSPGSGELTHEIDVALAPAATVRFSAAESMSTGGAGIGEAIAKLTGGARFDLVFSTAALHLMSDHRAALRTMASMLEPGGQLALQMPANDPHPASAIAAAVAPQFGLEPRAVNILSLVEYAEILFSLGFRRQVVRMQVYPRVLPSTADLFDCVRETVLTAYEARLPAPTFERFVRAYRDELRDGIRETSPYFFADRRLLIWASN